MPTPIDNTTIANLVADEAYLGSLIEVHKAARDTYAQAGLFRADARFNSQLSLHDGPRSAEFAFLNPLDATKWNVASDDINQKGKIGKITAGTFKAGRHKFSRGFASTDLTDEVTGLPTLAAIEARLGQYWLKVGNKCVGYTLNGVKAALGSAIVTEVEGSIKENAFEGVVMAESVKNIDADDMNIIAASPAAYAQLQLAMQVTGRSQAETSLTVPLFGGKYNVVKVAGLANDELTLLKTGSFIRAEGGASRPLELQRVADGGNGNGGDILWSRRDMFMHFDGMSYVATPLSGVYEDTVATTLADNDSYALISGISAADIGMQVIKFVPEA